MLNWLTSHRQGPISDNSVVHITESDAYGRPRQWPMAEHIGTAMLRSGSKSSVTYPIQY